MITREELIKVIGDGKIFSAVFKKKDNTERVMSARLGVQKNLKGVGHKFAPEEKNLLPVFDMNKREYRFINLSTCSKIMAHGQVYQ